MQFVAHYDLIVHQMDVKSATLMQKLIAKFT